MSAYNVTCGVIQENGEYSAIQCNSTSGECFFQDPLMGDNRLISEISIDAPSEISPEDAICDIESGMFGLCIGVIYTGDSAIVILDDETAVEVYLAAPTTPIEGKARMKIDIYVDYEED